MSLFGAMNTAISGLTSQSAAFTNISDNVANSQTVGYKEVDTAFMDYLTVSNASTNQSGAVVAKPEYRGTASGFAYMFVKLPSFLAIFLFPSLFAAIGQANATLFVAIFPLIGLLAAIFILPEIYGYEQD